MARLRRGDEGAFDELVNQHHGTLIRMAMGYVADREVAEEVVQDTWMAVIESLNRFEGRSSLRTWICGILIHKAKDRGVREKRHTTFSAFESYDDDNEEAVDPSRFQQSGEWAGHWAFPPQPWDDQTPEKLLAAKQAVDCMQRAIEALARNLKRSSDSPRCGRCRGQGSLRDAEYHRNQPLCSAPPGSGTGAGRS